MLLSRVLLVGCGGIGSLLAEPLARLLTYHAGAGPACRLTLADGDRFETGNAARQAMRAEDVGAHKARALAERLASAGFATPDVVPRYVKRSDVATWLRAASEAACLMPRPGYGSLVVLAVDNVASHAEALAAAVDDAREARDVCVLRPGNGAGERWGLATVSAWLRLDGVSRTVDPRAIHAELRAPADEVPTAGCAARIPSEPQRIAANMIAAAWTLAYVSALLDGRPIPDEHVAELGDGREIRGQAWRSGPAGSLVATGEEREPCVT